ncbi:ABC transporter substrate-binding protein [Paucibacter sp. DJ2R-2]|uniref:ABC transporter substrate-binding protein n=1 Tax=Paucibacter sp. DJ2R-2 TaxID=2893558 RepID=UPI0021E4CAC8|nr:ABC transporter substrate-binding protein [Paucibacter sp. DJ2R-2]MCV2419380.1 ABC transporter substrate-binding protein [Paucibacter sp. DJ4R-1]MCV2437716.1 ABC transporter substrate-binding protein [Paucibacter sp. DJ2R-2]
MSNPQGPTPTHHARSGAVRRALAWLTLAAACAPAWSAGDTKATAETAKSAPKVLRYAFRVAETGFDPAQISDTYSKTVAAGIFDAPLKFEYLASPAKLVPNTLVAMPEIAADFKTLTFEVKPGIYFNDDPAFKGNKRELTAADYIYSIKRHYDPQWKSPNLYLLENVKILGLSELRKELMAAKKPFDYDRPVEGLQQLSRYKFQIKLGVSDPRFINQFADSGFLGAVAREVVDAYHDKIMEHPVGTGAWRLAEWRRSSRIVLEKNPNYREEFYKEQPPADKPELAAQVKALQGRRLPMIDRVEIAIIEETQPRWLSFLGNEAEVLPELPFEFAGIAIPNNKLAPSLAKKGVQMTRFVYPEIAFSYFNMEDATVGGYTPEKIALRRAISLAMDVNKQIRLARRGQGIPAQGPSIPGVFGYDPSFKSEMSEFNLAKAKGLLDLYGYVDKNGDGWRDMPDGSPLRIEYATQPTTDSRQLVELWHKGMDALQVKMVFKTAKWPENLKSANAGKLQMWGVSWVASTPDNDTFLALGDGRAKGKANKARFDLPAFNELYQKQKALPDGPERQAVMREAQRLMIAYMPYKMDIHRIFTDLAQPWVIGYERNVFVRTFWNYVDIDQERFQRESK